jgi:hypothetical protein
MDSWRSYNKRFNEAVASQDPATCWIAWHECHCPSVARHCPPEAVRLYQVMAHLQPRKVDVTNLTVMSAKSLWLLYNPSH